MFALPFSVGAATTAAQALANFDKLVGDYNLITIKDADLSRVTETEGMIAVGRNLTVSEQTVNIATNANFADAAGYGYASMYVNGTFKTTSTNKDGIKLEHGYAYFGGSVMGSAGVASTSANWSSASKELTIKQKIGNNITSVAAYSQANSKSAKASANPFSSNPKTLDFGLLQNNFLSISQTLSNASVTGMISVGAQNQTLSLSPISSGQHGAIIFNLDMKKLTTDQWGNQYYNGVHFSQIHFDIPTNDDYIVNVINLTSSNNTLFKSINFSDNASDYDRLLWNFVGTNATDSVTVQTNNNFYGSILAPTYNLKGGSLLDGQIVAKSYTATYDGELHYSNFDDDLPETPEASTYGIFGAVACLALVGLRRARRQNR